LPGSGFIDSPEQAAEKQRIMQVAQQVNVRKTHLLGKEHFIGLLRKKQLPELDKFNVDMQTYYQLTQGGIRAPLAIHNVGGI